MDRIEYLEKISSAFKIHPIVAILGPRQCGKTTLARQFCKNLSKNLDIHYFDLEDPNDLALFTNPKQLLINLEKGIVIIDEIQRKAELFPILRVLVDREDNKLQFLILGSASQELIQQSSETLAGRVQFIELTPFSLTEVDNLQQLWLQGGFPRSYLADSTEDSRHWLEHYVRTFLERDMPSLGINIAPENMRRFWYLLSHYHGNIFNASEISRSLGISQPTSKNYIDILSHTFMIRQLKPWFVNISKRQVKASKIYFRDSGIFHTLLNIVGKDIFRHPKLGASWEGFALEEIIRKEQARPEECFFWATHTHAELDLLIVRGEKKLGFEFKYSDTPKNTKSLTIARQTLGLDNVTIIYPGDKDYKVSDSTSICGLANYIRR